MLKLLLTGWGESWHLCRRVKVYFSRTEIKIWQSAITELFSAEQSKPDSAIYSCPIFSFFYFQPRRSLMIMSLLFLSYNLFLSYKTFFHSVLLPHFESDSLWGRGLFAYMYYRSSVWVILLQIDSPHWSKNVFAKNEIAQFQLSAELVVFKEQQRWAMKLSQWGFW